MKPFFLAFLLAVASGFAADDLNSPERDWYLQNQGMVAALTEKGYDLKFAFGNGKHSHKHGASLLPESLRWLWRDYPK